jgi:hypothetical protein
MENGPFIDGLPIKNWDFPWLLQMLNNQRVYIFIYIFINPIYGDVWRIKNQFIRVVWASPKVCILRIFQIFRTIDPEME